MHTPGRVQILTLTKTLVRSLTRNDGVRTLRTRDSSALVPKCPSDISAPS